LHAGWQSQRSGSGALPGGFDQAALAQGGWTCVRSNLSGDGSVNDCGGQGIAG
jgi:hypothetical protein